MDYGQNAKVLNSAQASSAEQTVSQTVFDRLHRLRERVSMNHDRLERINCRAFGQPSSPPQVHGAKPEAVPNGMADQLAMLLDGIELTVQQEADAISKIDNFV